MQCKISNLILTAHVWGENSRSRCHITLHVWRQEKSPSRRYSCMTHLVFSPRGALPLQKTRVFFIPSRAPLEALYTSLSFPVAFQYPAPVALFVLNPVGYFLSLKLKKYHSLSPIFATSIKATNQQIHVKSEEQNTQTFNFSSLFSSFSMHIYL